MATPAEGRPDTPLAGAGEDLAPLAAWRRWLPAWLRALIWVDGAVRYDAFLSYTWKADAQVAPVIQSTIHRFLCPWYKTRAKTVFRDLSCLPAGSSLEKELFARMDLSTHLLVLASPSAAASRGMEIEARYWFARERKGEVLIVVTEGEEDTWDAIREKLIPPTLRDNLGAEPLWVPLQRRRAEIVTKARGPELQAKLLEDLKQILLRLYPGKDWGQLVGEERAQRRRALRLAMGAAILFLALTSVASCLAIYAFHEQHVAESRQLAEESALVADYDPVVGLDLALQAARRSATDEAYVSLTHILAAPMVQTILRHEGPVLRIRYSPDGARIATASADGTARVWRAPDGALLATMKGHSGNVLTLEFSNDGSSVVTGGEDGTTRVWDSSGRQLFNLPGTDEAGAVIEAAFSPDGSRIASAYENGFAALWNARDGKPITREEVCTDFSIHTAFSPDSSMWLASGSGCVVAGVYDAASGKGIAEIGRFDPKEAENYQGHGRPRYVNDALFTPDSKNVLLVMFGDKSSIWDARRGAHVRDLNGPVAALHSAAFSHNGNELVTVNDDNTMTIWDRDGTQMLQTLVGHTGRIFRAEFSRDDSAIFSGAADNTVREWSATFGNVLGTWGGGPVGGLLRDFACAPDRKAVATARSDDSAWIWDVKRGRPFTTLAGHTAGIGMARYSDDKKYLVTASADGTVRVWGSSTWTPLSVLDENPAKPAHALFSADGKWVIAYEESYANGMDQKDAVRVWDWRQRKQLATIRESVPIRDLTFSADRKRMLWVTGQEADTVVIRDLFDGKELTRLHEDDLIEGVSLAPDMKRVLTVTQQETAHLWDADAAKIVTSLAGKTFMQAEFTPRGDAFLTVQEAASTGRSRLPAMDREAEIRKWDRQGSHSTIVGAARSRSTPFIYSPDSSHAVQLIDDALVHEAQLIDVRHSSVLHKLEVPQAYLYSVDFSFDGKRFSIASGDDTARIWDGFTGDLKVTLRGHTGGVHDAIFSPDGLRIATASDDNTVRLWNAVSGQLLATYFLDCMINTNFHSTNELQKEHAVLFSPDGKYVLATCSAPSVPVFVADSQGLMQFAETLRPRQVGK